MFLLEIMLIYDKPLLSTQLPLNGHSWYPEDGCLMTFNVLKVTFFKQCSRVLYILLMF